MRHPAQASWSFPVNRISRIRLREIFIANVYLGFFSFFKIWSVLTTLASEPSKGHYSDVMQ